MQPPAFPPPPDAPGPPPNPWTPQPWPGGGTTTAPPHAYRPPPRRPGSVTAASVLLIVLSVPPILGAILAFVGAGLFHRVGDRFTSPELRNLRDLSDTVVRLIVVLAVLSLAYGIVKLVAGIRVLAGSNSWRVAGIVLAVMASALWVLALIGTLEGNNGTPETTRGSAAGGAVLSAMFLAANILVIVFLARARAYFEDGRYGAGPPVPAGPAPPPPQTWQQQPPTWQPQPQPQQWPQQGWPPAGGEPPGSGESGGTGQAPT